MKSAMCLKTGFECRETSQSDVFALGRIVPAVAAFA